MQVLHTILYTFLGIYKENLLNNTELLEFAISSFFLMTLIFDLGGDTGGRN